MRIKMTLSYDGSGYAGWQRQSNALGIETIVEEALARLHHHPIKVTASGRTDGGVHALAQVIHFDSEIEMGEVHWVRAMNALLPMDIRVQSAVPCEDGFHARFDAVRKRYDYCVSYDVNNPFHHRYYALYQGKLDIERMQRCADVLVGTHDFTSFTSSRIDPRKSRVRTLYCCQVIEEPFGVRFQLEGNSFLRYMVRMIVGTLMEAGRGRLDAAKVQEMLAAKDKHACRYKAPANGLYLVQVWYAQEQTQTPQHEDCMPMQEIA